MMICTNNLITEKYPAGYDWIIPRNLILYQQIALSNSSATTGASTNETVGKNNTR